MHMSERVPAGKARTLPSHDKEATVPSANPTSKERLSPVRDSAWDSLSIRMLLRR